jgi:hypothetical protein
MDSHITTLEFAVVNEAGRLVKADRVATSVKGFMGFVKTVPRPRTIYMEEGTLAAWALEVCVRFGEKLVITDPKENRWIGSSGQKDDSIDALKLAQLGRGGYVKEIHHPVGQRRRFRELMEAYHDTVRSTTRIKNKIKAKFRQNSIPCTGDTVYSETHREEWEEWKEKLSQDATLLLILEGLWQKIAIQDGGYPNPIYVLSVSNRFISTFNFPISKGLMKWEALVRDRKSLVSSPITSPVIKAILSVRDLST